MTFFSTISFGPYCARRCSASTWVRPSGDDPSRFSTSATGRVFRSSVASGFEPEASRSVPLDSIAVILLSLPDQWQSDRSLGVPEVAGRSNILGRNVGWTGLRRTKPTLHEEVGCHERQRPQQPLLRRPRLCLRLNPVPWVTDSVFHIWAVYALPRRLEVQFRPKARKSHVGVSSV